VVRPAGAGSCQPRRSKRRAGLAEHARGRSGSGRRAARRWGRWQTGAAKWVDRGRRTPDCWRQSASSSSPIVPLTRRRPGPLPRAFRVIAVIDATFRGGASPDTGPVSRNVTGRGSGDRRPSFLPLRALHYRSLYLRWLRPRSGLLPRLPCHPTTRVDAARWRHIPAHPQGGTQARGSAGQVFVENSDASRIPHRRAERHLVPVAGARCRARRHGGSRWHCGRRRYESGARS
jgi:hypothetical protein